ncbi:MAG: alanyl-tRNA editing protein, partial [Myxococcota bacterium]
GAETVSSRLGETNCTIDLDVPELDPSATAEAFARVQEVIDADVEVRAWFPSAAELRALPLRREPKVEKEVRVVEVAGFDVSPCGGTHCTRSGQVGLVRLTGVERYKGKTRVSFSAGGRARDELFAESAVLGALARRFTCGALEVGAAIEAQDRSLAEARDALSRARAQLLEQAAAALEAQMAEASAPWYFALLEDQDPEGLRKLLPRLVTRSGRVVLLACPHEGALHVVLGRGPDSDFDCGGFFRLGRERLGARGGGKPDRAEGRIAANADITSLVAELLRRP